MSVGGAKEGVRGDLLVGVIADDESFVVVGLGESAAGGVTAADIAFGGLGNSELRELVAAVALLGFGGAREGE